MAQFVSIYEFYLYIAPRKRGSLPGNHTMSCGIVEDHEKIATEALRAFLEHTAHEYMSCNA